MVKNRSKQMGSTIPSYVGILLMVSVGAWYALENSQTVVSEQSNKLVMSMKGQVMQRINALQSCYHETRDWCAPNELETYGLPTDAINNSFVVDQLKSGGDVKLTVQAPSIEAAMAFSKHVMEPELNGPQVTFTVKPPTDSDILKNQLQRYADTRHQRNSLESNIEMGTRNVKNFEVARASKGEFQELNSGRQLTAKLEVSRKLSLGSNEIGFNDEGVLFDATSTNISGQANINGDLELNNNDIDGINEAHVSELLTNSLAASTGVISELKGDNVKYDNGNITTVTSYKYVSDTFNTEQMKVVDLNSSNINSNFQADNASIDELNFLNANGQNWKYNTSNTNQLVSKNSSVGMADGQNMAVQTDMRGQTIKANSGRFTSASVLGLTAGGDFYSNDDFVTSKSSVNRNLSSLVNQDSAISNNTSSINNTKGKINTAGRDIASNESAIAKNERDASTNRNAIDNNKRDIATNELDIDNVAKRLDNSADELGLWQDRLDKCMYQTQYCIPQDPSLSLSCIGCSQAEPQASFTATALATISACRQGCTYSWVVTGALSKSGGTCASGTIPRGGSATPSCKVTKSNILPQDTVTGSIKIEVNNSHYTDRMDSKIVSVSFKNTTIPRPTVNTSCSGCNSSRSSSSFNALVTSSISNCPQGCNYSWSISGGASGSCSSGSVTAGGSASPSCSISGNVADASTMSGNVSLVVTNSVSPSYSAQDSESYSWQNTTPSNPFNGLSYGCWVDTAAYDQASFGSCDGRVEAPRLGSAIFSVGDYLGAENFNFSNSSQWSVIWSGACTGSGNSCTTGGVGDLIATATVTHIPTGSTKTFTVWANICQIRNGEATGC